MSPACTRLAVVFACLAPLASTPAPLAAQAIAAYLAGEEPDAFARALDPRRFALGG